MSLRKKLSRTQFRADKMSKRGTGIFVETTNNMMLIGECSCGAYLYHYIKSEPNNIFNVYCANPDCDIQDARQPNPKSFFYTDEELTNAKEIVLFIQKAHNKKEYTEEELASIPLLYGVPSGK